MGRRNVRFLISLAGLENRCCSTVLSRNGVSNSNSNKRRMSPNSQIKTKEAEEGGEGAVIYIDNCALWSDAQIKSSGLNR